jgi:hypothetical protein
MCAFSFSGCLLAKPEPGVTISSPSVSTSVLASGQSFTVSWTSDFDDVPGYVYWQGLYMADEAQAIAESGLGVTTEFPRLSFGTPYEGQGAHSITCTRVEDDRLDCGEPDDFPMLLGKHVYTLLACQEYAIGTEKHCDAFSFELDIVAQL